MTGAEEIRQTRHKASSRRVGSGTVSTPKFTATLLTTVDGQEPLEFSGDNIVINFANTNANGYANTFVRPAISMFANFDGPGDPLDPDPSRKIVPTFNSVAASNCYLDSVVLAIVVTILDITNLLDLANNQNFDAKNDYFACQGQQFATTIDISQVLAGASSKTVALKIAVQYILALQGTDIEYSGQENVLNGFVPLVGYMHLLASDDSVGQACFYTAPGRNVITPTHFKNGGLVAPADYVLHAETLCLFVQYTATLDTSDG